MQLIIGLSDPNQPIIVDVEEKPLLEKKAKLDILNNLKVLDEHLCTRTYIVGEKITLADVSLFAVYRSIMELNVVDASQLPSLFRWYMTIASLPHIKSVVGGKNPIQADLKLINPTEGMKGYTDKWNRQRIRVKELLKEGESAIGKEVTLKGWIRTSRSAEKGVVLFVELTDGSTVKGMQLVMNIGSTIGMKETAECGGVGASLSVKGIVVASPAKGQTIEVHVHESIVLGAVYGGDKGEIGGKNYPMAKKQHGLEFLREKAHLRPRSKVFSSAMRIRHAMAFATNKVIKILIFQIYVLKLTN